MAKTRQNEINREADRMRAEAKRAAASLGPLLQALKELQANAESASSSAMDDYSALAVNVAGVGMVAGTGAARAANIRTELESYTTDDTTDALYYLTLLDSQLADCQTVYDAMYNTDLPAMLGIVTDLLASFTDIIELPVPTSAGGSTRIRSRR
jgi:hypothetical protein